MAAVVAASERTLPVHRCGVLFAEVRAGQYTYNDIEVAAAHLHGVLDAHR